MARARREGAVAIFGEHPSRARESLGGCSMGSGQIIAHTEAGLRPGMLREKVRPVPHHWVRKSKNRFRGQHGFVPESAWLLLCKQLFGLAAPGTAPKENPCPPEKVEAIKQAFRRFGLL